MITQFTSKNLSDLRADINEALKQVGLKHGISISAGSCSYSAAEATYKIVCRSKDTKIAANANGPYIKMLGLPDDIIGQTFTYQSKKYTITGINKRKPKFNIECMCDTTGKPCLWSHTSVKNIMGIN